MLWTDSDGFTRQTPWPCRRSTWKLTSYYNVYCHAWSTGTTSDQPDNWERQIKKGWLELAILASLWAEKLYGLEILRRLEEATDLVVAEGTVYPILSRLKADGLVETEMGRGRRGPSPQVLLADARRTFARQTMARYASGFLGSISQIIAPLLAKEKK